MREATNTKRFAQKIVKRISNKVEKDKKNQSEIKIAYYVHGVPKLNLEASMFYLDPYTPLEMSFLSSRMRT